MNDNTLTQPIGGGMTLRLTHNPERQSLVARLVRGTCPQGQMLVFAIALRDEIERCRVTAEDGHTAPSVWIGTTNFEISASAAKRLRAWFAAQGIRHRDDLPTTPATDTATQVAPGATA